MATAHAEQLAPPREGPASAHGAEPGGHDDAGSIAVRRWKRYGKDRLYANAADGLRLGYLDVATGELHLEVADPTGTITAQLRATHRDLAGPAVEGDPRR